MMKAKEEEPFLTTSEKIKFFMVAHWRGVVIIATPIVLIFLLTPFPPEKYQWTAYTLLIMAMYWVTECIPLAVTSFIPIVLFPLTDVQDTRTCCRCYMNDSIMMFLGSLILAYSVEQSGLHKRMAYYTIRLIGYSHLKLLLAMCCVTTFVSMWITNTAATTMMVPINLALLKVFEDQKAINIYERTPDGDRVASNTTVCYFCAATISASVGGIGTIVGTDTNLVWTGLFATSYPEAPEYLSFPRFSAFCVPTMVLIEVTVYFYMVILYFGFLRPGSDTAKKSIMPVAAKLAAKAAIAAELKKMGNLSYWETCVCLLFGGAMVSFFCRTPQLFFGWGDAIHLFFHIEDTRFVRDSALAMFVCFIMFVLPRKLDVFKNCTAKDERQLPKGRQLSLLDWKLLNSMMPYAFMFLLGGGFALSGAAKSSGLNEKLGQQMQSLSKLPNVAVLLITVLVIVLVTNFASNVAVCNVFTPVAMQLAKEIHQNPLWYCIASGIAASFAFMMPVGTPGNLIVQSAASIPTGKMVVAGFGPTFFAILISWLFVIFWAPVIWPDLTTLPPWVHAEA